MDAVADHLVAATPRWTSAPTRTTADDARPTATVTACTRVVTVRISRASGGGG